VSPRHLWLTEIDESTPPFSFKGIEMGSGDSNTEQFAPCSILSQDCQAPRRHTFDTVNKRFFQGTHANHGFR
jgi:hypothetical protein